MDLTHRNRPVRLAAAVFTGMMFFSLGCMTASRLTGKLPGSFGQSARDDVLRESVESDDFPAAGQVGL